MKTLLRPSNLIFLAILGFFLWKQAPSLLKNSQLEGQSLSSQTYSTVGAERAEVTFPREDQRALLIFWATWCGPCMIEMDRLNQSVKAGKISRSAIFAANPFESAEIVREFLKKKPFPFTFIDAPPLARQLEVAATPTTVLLDGTLIKSVKMGMSVTGIWDAERFLSEAVTPR